MQLPWQSDIIARAKILEREPGNTSTHDPVLATIHASLGPKAPTLDTPTPESTSKRTNWRTIDKDAYAEFTEASLRRLLEERETVADPEVMVEELTACLWEASQAAQTVVPGKASTKKTRKGLWHPALKPYVAESKKAH